MKRWCFSGLSARIIGLTVLALLVSQAVGYFSFRHNSEDFIEHMVRNYMGRIVAALDSSLQFVEPDHRSEMVRSLSRRRSRYTLLQQPPSCPYDDRGAQAFAQPLATQLGVASERVRVCITADSSQPEQSGNSAAKALVVALQRNDGDWLTMQQRLSDHASRWAWRALRNLLITLVIMTLVVVIVSIRFTRPLRDLAGAAERFGRGEDTTAVPVRGSDEIRRSIVEFNAMRERIDRFVAERNRLVAALAHDLRSPITALRLRLEMLPADDNTRAMISTVDDMAQMSEATLSFMREETNTEQARRMDLTALVDAVCEDYLAAGKALTFAPEHKTELVCRPVAVRRALRNVIDNALAYGYSATVTLRNETAAAIIEVVDCGPGIPEAQRQCIFDAFVRLETSRSRDTGGVGLGLAIARSIIRSHGGDITLHNPPEGGLAVRMTLPKARFA